MGPLGGRCTTALVGAQRKTVAERILQNALLGTLNFDQLPSCQKYPYTLPDQQGLTYSDISPESLRDRCFEKCPRALSGTSFLTVGVVSIGATITFHSFIPWGQNLSFQLLAETCLHTF